MNWKPEELKLIEKHKEAIEKYPEEFIADHAGEDGYTRIIFGLLGLLKRPLFLEDYHDQIEVVTRLKNGEEYYIMALDPAIIFSQKHSDNYWAFYDDLRDYWKIDERLAHLLLSLVQEKKV